MSTPKLITMRLCPLREQEVRLDDVDITHAVMRVEVSADAREPPAVMLHISTLQGVNIPQTLADVSCVDTTDALRLRDYLADALEDMEQLAAQGIPLTPAMRMHMAQWGLHREGPNGEPLSVQLRRWHESQRMKGE